MAYKNILCKALILTLALSILLPGCAQKGGETFRSSDQQKANTVHYGTVLSVRTVQIDTEATGIGAVLGGVAGGVLGSLFGSGSGKTAATVGGAAIGALGGYATERGISKHDALEIIVQLDNGSHIAVVQDADNYYAKGDKVMVITSPNGGARVQHQ